MFCLLSLITDIFILQILAFITLIFFTNTFNILSLWYLAGIYLIILGLWLLLDDGDIFVGFLWVIDLGVGLVFFIFILHYSTFTQQKVNLDKSSKQVALVSVMTFFSLSFFYFSAQPLDLKFIRGFDKTWFYLISWYNYYDFFFSSTVTDLNLLREIYFYNNSFEFFLINFLLFYGIINSILAAFLIKRIFSFLNLNQYLNYTLLSKINSTYFIRNQNFLKQQATSTGARVWFKRKY